MTDKNNSNMNISMDQSGWQIAGNVNIYNIAGDLNNHSSKQDYIGELKKLNEAIAQSSELQKNQKDDIKEQLDSALAESSKDHPDKSSIVTNLQNAGKSLDVAGKTLGSVLGFGKAVLKVVTWVDKFLI